MGHAELGLLFVLSSTTSTPRNISVSSPSESIVSVMPFVIPVLADSICFLTSSSSESLTASSTVFWNSLDNDFNLPIHMPTVLSALGISLGPTTNNAITVMTKISVQPISSILDSFYW